MKRIIVLLFFVSSAVLAQKTKVVSGNFENLKGITEYNLVFDYVCTNVKGFPEEVYIANVMKEHADEGDVKFGKEFKERWYSDKKKIFEPAFIRSFNKRFEGEIKMGSDLTTAKYTVTLKTTFMDTGCMGCGASGRSSRTNAFITISENANPGNVLLVYSFEMENKVPTKKIHVGF